MSADRQPVGIVGLGLIGTAPSEVDNSVIIREVRRRR